jgi:superoxide dismutase, Cu-Zn family
MNRILLLAAVSLGVWAMARASAGHEQLALSDAAANHAMCTIEPTKGNTCKGVVHFTQEGDKVKVVADLSGLAPETKHGFHIHEGTEVGEDGMKAGGHYNPDKHQHGLPDKPAAERHAGDFGNLTADKEGKAHLEITVDNITINGSKNPIVGHAMIVHEKADDGGQPTGNAGGRIGGGIIKLAEAKPG